MARITVRKLRSGVSSVPWIMRDLLRPAWIGRFESFDAVLAHLQRTIP